MSIQRGISTAMGNDYIMTVGTGVLRYDHRSGLGCINGRRIAHASDIRSLMVCGTNAARRFPTADGRCDIPAVCRPDIAAGLGGILSLLLCQLLGHLNDLLADAFFLSIQFRKNFLVLRLVILDLIHQRFCLSILVSQIRLFAYQIPLRLFRTGFVNVQFRFLLGNIRLYSLQVVNDTLVGGHDLIYPIQIGQHITEAAGVEQNRPITDGASLLHSPNPAAEQVILIRLLRLDFLQLSLTLCDQLLIVGDQLLIVGDLTDNHTDPLIQQFFALECRRFILGQFGKLFFQFSLFLLQFVRLLLQLVDIRLRDTCSRCRKHQFGQNHRQRQQQCRRRTQNPMPAISIVRYTHSFSL